MNIATLPITTKIIAALAVGLFLSVTGNVLQLRSAWIGAGEAKGENARLTLSAENQQLAIDSKVNKAIAESVTKDSAGLLKELGLIAERAKETKVVYAEAAAKAPLPVVCFPGKARMDAVNDGLRGAIK